MLDLDGLVYADGARSIPTGRARRSDHAGLSLVLRIPYRPDSQWTHHRPPLRRTALRESGSSRSSHGFRECPPLLAPAPRGPQVQAGSRLERREHLQPPVRQAPLQGLREDQTAGGQKCMTDLEVEQILQWMRDHGFLISRASPTSSGETEIVILLPR